MADSRTLTVCTGSSRSLSASDLVIAGELGFISGVGPVDLENDRAPLPEMIEAQTEKIFTNLDVILAAAGLTQRNLLSVRVYLIDFDRLVERMNQTYVRCLGTQSLPTRSCIGVARLTRGALVEMDFTVHAQR